MFDPVGFTPSQGRSDCIMQSDVPSPPTLRPPEDNYVPGSASIAMKINIG